MMSVTNWKGCGRYQSWSISIQCPSMSGGNEEFNKNLRHERWIQSHRCAPGSPEYEGSGEVW